MTSLHNLFSSFINAIFFKVKVGYNELISLLNTVISIQTFSEPKWKVKEARRNTTLLCRFSGNYININCDKEKIL